MKSRIDPVSNELLSLLNAQFVEKVVDIPNQKPVVNLHEKMKETYPALRPLSFLEKQKQNIGHRKDPQLVPAHSATSAPALSAWDLLAPSPLPSPTQFFSTPITNGNVEVTQTSKKTKVNGNHLGKVKSTARSHSPIQPLKKTTSKQNLPLPTAMKKNPPKTATESPIPILDISKSTSAIAVIPVESSTRKQIEKRYLPYQEFLATLPSKLRYYFVDESYANLLYKLCHVSSEFTDSSFRRTVNKLEWLGDKVLNFVVSEWLIDHALLQDCTTAELHLCCVNFVRNLNNEKVFGELDLAISCQASPADVVEIIIGALFKDSGGGASGTHVAKQFIYHNYLKGCEDQILKIVKKIKTKRVPQIKPKSKTAETSRSIPILDYVDSAFSSAAAKNVTGVDVVLQAIERAMNTSKSNDKNPPIWGSFDNSVQEEAESSTSLDSVVDKGDDFGSANDDKKEASERMNIAVEREESMRNILQPQQLVKRRRKLSGISVGLALTPNRTGLAGSGKNEGVNDPATHVMAGVRQEASLGAVSRLALTREKETNIGQLVNETSLTENPNAISSEANTEVISDNSDGDYIMRSLTNLLRLKDTETLSSFDAKRLDARATRASSHNPLLSPAKLIQQPNAQTPLIFNSSNSTPSNHNVNAHIFPTTSARARTTTFLPPLISTTTKPSDLPSISTPNRLGDEESDDSIAVFLADDTEEVIKNRTKSYFRTPSMSSLFPSPQEDQRYASVLTSLFGDSDGAIASVTSKTAASSTASQITIQPSIPTPSGIPPSTTTTNPIISHSTTTAKPVISPPTNKTKAATLPSFPKYSSNDLPKKKEKLHLEKALPSKQPSGTFDAGKAYVAHILNAKEQQLKNNSKPTQNTNSKPTENSNSAKNRDNAVHSVSRKGSKSVSDISIAKLNPAKDARKSSVILNSASGISGQVHQHPLTIRRDDDDSDTTDAETSATTTTTNSKPKKEPRKRAHSRAENQLKDEFTGANRSHLDYNTLLLNSLGNNIALSVDRNQMSWLSSSAAEEKERRDLLLAQQKGNVKTPDKIASIEAALRRGGGTKNEVLKGSNNNNTNTSNAKNAIESSGRKPRSKSKNPNDAAQEREKIIEESIAMNANKNAGNQITRNSNNKPLTDQNMNTDQINQTNRRKAEMAKKKQADTELLLSFVAGGDEKIEALLKQPLMKMVQDKAQSGLSASSVE